MERPSFMTLLSAVLLWGCTSSTPDPPPSEAPPSEATPVAPEPAEPTLSPVRLGIAIPSYVHAIAWIADENGHFEREGLDASVEVMGGSAATMRALLAGSIDVGLAGGDAVIKANAAGADLVIVAGFVNRFYHRIIARPEASGPDGLRGRKVGLPFLGGPQDMAVRYALQGMGLTYGEDVEVLSLGREFNRMAALSRGDIDATTSQTPLARLEELGFVVVADLPAAPVAFPYAMLVTTRQALSERSAQAEHTLAALCAGAADYQSQEAQSLATIQQHIQGSDTEAVAAARYRESGPSLLSLPPEPDHSGLQMVVDFLGPEAVGEVTAGSVVDSRVLDTVRSRGGCGGL